MIPLASLADQQSNAPLQSLIDTLSQGQQTGVQPTLIAGLPKNIVPPMPIIRNAEHLNNLIQKAESDDDLRAIKGQMEKQGLWTGFMPWP